MTLVSKYDLSIYKRPMWKSNGKTVALDSITTVEEGASTFDYLAFPGFAIDANGKYHGVYRRGSGHNNDSNGFIAYITSTDQGTTWSAPVSIVPHAADRVTNCTIFITSSGRIIVTYGWEVSTPSTKRYIYFIYSDDGGSTWETAARFTEDYDANQITSPNKAIEIGGNLYFMAYATNVVPGGSREGPLYKSTDDGLTWTKIATMYPIENFNGEEPSPAVSRDGRMISLVRSDPDDYTFMMWSPNFTDWSRFSRAYPSYGKNPMAVSPSGTILTCGRYSVAGDNLDRSIWAYSSDDGKTWTWDFLTETADAYMYSELAWDASINKFVGLLSYVPEGGSDTTGPCNIYCVKFNEV